MDDPQLRSALKRTILAAHTDDPNTRIIDELGLAHGLARVDVAVVNGRLHGYEIKSDLDTLNRLSGQVAVYNSVFDRMTLIAGKRHAEHALRLTPEWWGVKQALVGPRGGIRFRTLRRADPNPSVQALSVARLLWRDEALMLLERLGEARGFSKKPRAQVFAHLAETAPLNLLRSYVRECLKSRRIHRFG